MKMLRFFLLMLAVVMFVSFGSYGCAKKQVKGEEGKVESQKPGQPGTEGAGEKKEEGKREVTEAPPGPKETPEVSESQKGELALEDVHFDFDRYDIRPGDADILSRDAGWAKKNPGQNISIEGHCDERGTVEYNLALGERRAEAAKNYLVSLGVDAGVLKTISYGKSKPMDDGHDEAAWAKNRRAHFVVVR
jgi:peptidoglycan-associated lipoprotein